MDTTEKDGGKPSKRPREGWTDAKRTASRNAFGSHMPRLTAAEALFRLQRL